MATLVCFSSGNHIFFLRGVFPLRLGFLTRLLTVSGVGVQFSRTQSNRSPGPTVRTCQLPICALSPQAHARSRPLATHEPAGAPRTFVCALHPRARNHRKFSPATSRD